MTAPPIPEELKGVEKKRLDVVYAAGPGSVVYAIPLSVAEQYVHVDGHQPIPSHAELAAAVEAGAEKDEDGGVEGHHAVVLGDGIVGYHVHWEVGPFIWHRTGTSFYGPHRHPWNNHLAADLDG